MKRISDLNPSPYPIRQAQDRRALPLEKGELIRVNFQLCWYKDVPPLPSSRDLPQRGRILERSRLLSRGELKCIN
jgi:hypothetical protein